MTDDKKKMTAQGSSVGVDDGQSISQNSKTTIPDPDKKKQFPRKRFGGTLPEDAPHERPGIPLYCDPGRADG